MRAILLLCILLAISSMVHAQSYGKSIGYRAGDSHGYYFDTEGRDGLSTIRFMLSGRKQGHQFTVMKYFRKYKVAELPSDFSLYYGFGLHGGFNRWEAKRTINDKVQYVGYTAPVVGLDGLLGISYHFQGFPLAVSFEVKPYFDMWGRNIFSINPFDSGFTIAYFF